MLLSFVQAVVACNVTVPRVCTLVQAKIRQDTRLWYYSGLKPTKFASSVQAAVASNVTALRVCTLVLFISSVRTSICASKYFSRSLLTVTTSLCYTNNRA